MGLILDKGVGGGLPGGITRRARERRKQQEYEGQGTERSGRGMVCAKALCILEKMKEVGRGRDGERPEQLLRRGRTGPGPSANS